MTHEVAAAVEKSTPAGKKTAEEAQQEKGRRQGGRRGQGASLGSQGNAAKAAAKAITEKEAAAADARKTLNNPKG